MNKKGFTLVEVIMTVGILSIVIPILTVLFISMNKSFVTFEAFNSMKKVNQETINRIYIRLGRNKRLFQEKAEDIAFLNVIDLTDCPSVLSGSKLPIIRQSGSLSPSSTTFDGTTFGNSLFFTYNIMPAILENIVTDASGTKTQSVRIDLYRFIYYYLTSDDSPLILNKQTYKLVEWESNKYADCNQLEDISNPIKKPNTIAALVNEGVSYCFASSMSDVALSFYNLTISAGEGVKTLDAVHAISKNKHKVLTKITTGLMMGSYRYGIAPNTSDMGSVQHPVPAYAVESGNFPSGFEIGISGLSAGREVLVRHVLMANTSVGSLLTYPMSIISSSRDIW